MKINNRQLNRIINESVNRVLNEITFGSKEIYDDPSTMLDNEIKELFQMIDNKVKILNSIAASTEDYRVTRKAKFIVDSLLRTADIIDHKINGARGLRY